MSLLSRSSMMEMVDSLGGRRGEGRGGMARERGGEARERGGEGWERGIEKRVDGEERERGMERRGKGRGGREGWRGEGKGRKQTRNDVREMQEMGGEEEQEDILIQCYTAA